MGFTRAVTETRCASTDVLRSWSLVEHADLQSTPIDFDDATAQLAGLDPRLLPLADNGGPTPTHALEAGSPAVNAGDLVRRGGLAGTPGFDQRGSPFVRVGNGRIDLGAFETDFPALVVDSVRDEDDGDFSVGAFSLREAIRVANETPGHSAIEFDRAIGGTLVLTEGELFITDELSIVGPGAEALTIRAGGNRPDRLPGGARIFRVDDAVSGRQFEVSIAGLTLAGGDAAGAGGAVYNRESLVLDDVSMTDNHAVAGGAVATEFGTLVIRSSRISGNHSGFGGGVYARNSSVEIHDSEFELNRATLGGGLFAQSSDVVIDGSRIENGEAAVGGGLYFEAIRAQPGAAQISNSEITGNDALASGGGVYSAALPLQIDNTTIHWNRAGRRAEVVSPGTLPLGFGSGGGVAVVDAQLSISDSDIFGNEAFGCGGGVDVVSAESLTLRNVTLEGNTLFDARQRRVDPGEFELRGVGLHAAVANAEIIESRFNNHHAYDGRVLGGGAYIDTTGRLLIGSSEFNDNVLNGGEGRGGGLYAHSPAATVADAMFRRNRVQTPGSVGAGAFVRGVVEISDSEFHDNLTTAEGGGLAAIGDVAVRNSRFWGNEADAGGGLHFFAGDLRVDHSEFAMNHAAAVGGGIAVGLASNEQPGEAVNRSTDGLLVGAQPVTNVQIVGSIIQFNSADQDGGGVYLDSGPDSVANLEIRDSTLRTNRAQSNGGGVAVVADNRRARFDFINSTASANGARLQGGGIYLAMIAGLFRIHHATIVLNQVGRSGDPEAAGGGIFSAARTGIISHSIVALNSARRSQRGPDLGGETSGTMRFFYNLLGTNVGTNFAEAPLGSPDNRGNLIGSSASRINPALETLRDNGGPTLTHALTPDSPALDAGLPRLTAGLIGELYDQRGADYRRVWNGRIDIGAFERQPDPADQHGDFDLSLVVAGGDFLQMQRTVSRTDQVNFATGDATADGRVDARDVDVWAATYGLVLRRPGRVVAPEQPAPDEVRDAALRMMAGESLFSALAVL